MNRLLEHILSDDFLDDVGVELPPAALRERLKRLQEYTQFKLAIETGAITFQMLKSFVHQFETGKKFDRNVVLAFLAVVLEDELNPFADDYLNSLADLNLAETASASRVARKCLVQRPVSTRNTFVEVKKVGQVAFDAKTYDAPSTLIYAKGV